jgi:hypothetical protein
MSSQQTTEKVETEDSTPQAVEDNFYLNPEQWRPMRDEDFNMFGSTNEREGPADWDKLDYGQARDCEWYRQKFPGFGDEILEILAKCDGTSPDDNTKDDGTELANKFTVSFD